MSTTPLDPDRTPTDDSNAGDSETETVAGDDTVTIRRSPRYFRFAVLGAIVGVIVAFVLTFSFPEPQGFNAAQIFGFLALLFIIGGMLLGAVVALLIDRSTRRHARTVSIERIEGGYAPPEIQAQTALPETALPETALPETAPPETAPPETEVSEPQAAPAATATDPALTKADTTAVRGPENSGHPTD
ncbi:hypothetical protein [Subtercola sp. RTI3]|uniref:DUF2273 domain-containing protein n=1 Tax=Subtercola sp. RTI3 TaxID=3048639 RepID=UPI002B23ED72|nr:hypothetical protein [Subtercola sp. RTI3]MEA9986967.1 hypothetical protein [Subtercola sp. RTI3]